jgi:hypothetical protein
MIKQPLNSEYDLVSDLDQNKYTVFEEVRDFLEPNGIIWEHMFQLFRKSEAGHLLYTFGDVSICFFRTTEFSEETDEVEDAIELQIETKRGNVQKQATYVYKIKDLVKARRTRQSRVDGFGE